MMPFVVGFAGRAGAGKSTVSETLRKILYGLYWNDGKFSKHKEPLSLAFADSLKWDLTKLVEVMGVEYREAFAYFHDPARKNEIIPGTKSTARHLMQFYGTEFVRNNISSDYWIKDMEQRIRINMEDEDLGYVLIDDVRFEDEAAFCKEHGVLIWVSPATMPAHSDEHASEQLTQAASDRIFHNIGPRSELEGAVNTQLVPWIMEQKEAYSAR